MVSGPSRGKTSNDFLFFNIPHSFHFASWRKAQTQQYPVLTFLYFHLLSFSFNISPIASLLSCRALVFTSLQTEMLLHGCEQAMFCQPGAYAIFSQQIIAQ